MYDYHILLGVTALVFALVGYGLYFLSILRGNTKPHPFTWFVFMVVDGTVFFVQVMNGGGPGAWVLGLSSFLNAVVFLLALTRGEKQIARIDWVCLLCALGGIVMWQVTNQPFSAVLFAAATDAIAKIPTIRKSYLRPQEESISIWVVDMAKFSVSIAALSSITYTTAFFPAEIVLSNAIVIFIILLRRRQLKV